ncbi:MAG: TolC family protein, partial [Flavobacteriales bacterium]|nr:TolC family protein [Flavobacteriales bacterium]
MRLIFSLYLILVGLVSLGQEAASTLTSSAFLKQVANHHPVARVADFAEERTNAIMRAARGGFDPSLFADWSGKQFEDKLYYNRLYAGIELPTRLGPKLEAGFADNRGDFLNPAELLPEGGLTYAGVSVPIGNGLLIDNRRAALKKAKLAEKLNESERILVLNELLLDAGRAYWDWAAAYQKLELAREGLSLTSERLVNVRSNALLGAAASIDTLEAHIQWQNRQVSLNEAESKWISSSLKLSVYLWDEGVRPLELIDNVTPEKIITTSDDFPMALAMADSLIPEHALVNFTKQQADQEAIELRLRREYIKPTLDLKYRVLESRTL